MDCYKLTLFYLSFSWLKAPPKKEPDLNNKKYKHYQKKIYRQLKYFIKVIYVVRVASNNSGAMTRIRVTIVGEKVATWKKVLEQKYQNN